MIWQEHFLQLPVAFLEMLVEIARALRFRSRHAAFHRLHEPRWVVRMRFSGKAMENSGPPSAELVVDW